MSESPRDSELARLLAGRDGPSVLDKEAVFEGVMAGVAPPPRRRRWWALVAPLAAAAALALALVARPGADPGPEFGMKGPGGANLALTCVRGQAPAACAPGTTLLFDVTPAPARPFFAAFGRRADGQGVWLWPEAGARSAEVRGLTKRGFLLEAGGVVEVYGLFTAAPMSRDELQAGLADGLESTDVVTVVRRDVEGLR